MLYSSLCGLSPSLSLLLFKLTTTTALTTCFATWNQRCSILSIALPLWPAFSPIHQQRHKHHNHPLTSTTPSTEHTPTPAARHVRQNSLLTFLYCSTPRNSNFWLCGGRQLFLIGESSLIQTMIPPIFPTGSLPQRLFNRHLPFPSPPPPPPPPQLALPRCSIGWGQPEVGLPNPKAASLVMKPTWNDTTPTTSPEEVNDASAPGESYKREIKFKYHMSLTPQLALLSNSVKPGIKVTIHSLSPFPALKDSVFFPPQKKSRKRQVGRICTHCSTAKTTEWRMGPEGRGTLCNAYGLIPLQIP